MLGRRAAVGAIYVASRLAIYRCSSTLGCERLTHRPAKDDGAGVQPSAAPRRAAGRRRVVLTACWLLRRAAVAPACSPAHGPARRRPAATPCARPSARALVRHRPARPGRLRQGRARRPALAAASASRPPPSPSTRASCSACSPGCAELARRGAGALVRRAVGVPGLLLALLVIASPAPAPGSVDHRDRRGADPRLRPGGPRADLLVRSAGYVEQAVDLRPVPARLVTAARAAQRARPGAGAGDDRRRRRPSSPRRG